MREAGDGYAGCQRRERGRPNGARCASQCENCYGAEAEACKRDVMTSGDNAGEQ